VTFIPLRVGLPLVAWVIVLTNGRTSRRGIRPTKWALAAQALCHGVAAAVFEVGGLVAGYQLDYAAPHPARGIEALGAVSI
jgi:hypothetical protein